MIADLHVVRDHDLVVQLHTVADQRIGQCSTVDGGVRADLDVVADGHPADLGDLLPDALLVGETEAFATDHRARLDAHPRADSDIVVERDPRRQPAAFADHATGADHAMRADTDASADAGAALDHRIGADAGARIDLGVRRDDGAGMDTGGRLRLAVEQVRQAGIGQVGVGHYQRGTGEPVGVRSRQQDGAGTAFGQVLAILRVGQEAQMSRSGLLQGRQALDRQVRVATKLRADMRGQLAQGIGQGTHHQRSWFIRSITWRVMSYCGLTSTTAPRSMTMS